MPDVKNMVLQLVSDVAKSDEGWNTLTDALVDDAVELALDEVMKDKKYAMLLKTKLGASTVEEVRAEVKKQLVNDPTFMNSVRAQVKTAADEASKGVSQGWSDQKVLDRLQANLLPISGLVANKIDELGSSAGNIADNKVDDTVHKFLPGKLGDWVSDKVGNKHNIPDSYAPGCGQKQHGASRKAAGSAVWAGRQAGFTSVATRPACRTDRWFCRPASGRRARRRWRRWRGWRLCG
jgi:hypothetical protein